MVSSQVRIIHLEVSISIALEALISLKPLRNFTSNPLTLVKGFNGCRGGVDLAIGEEIL